MNERRVVDGDGREWTVSETMVGARAVGQGDPLPEAGPWLTFRLGDESLSGASAVGLDEMSDRDLIGLLQELKTDSDS